MRTYTLNKSSELHPTRFSDAAASGLRVFPVRPRDKVPATKWTQYQDRAPTPEELATWDASDYGLGIITGRASGIAVLDVDCPEAEVFVATLGLPPTPRLTTGRGTHYYFKVPAEGVRNATGIAGHKLDLRGEGGYVVGHGSIHPSGARYEWVVSPAEVPFADFPAALADLIHVRSEKAAGSHARAGSEVELVGDGRFDRNLADALADAKAELTGAKEGKRNDTLFRVGVRLARHVAGAGAEWASYAATLASTAVGIGLGHEEAERTLESCWANGSEEPTPWMLTAREWLYLSKPHVFYHRASREYLKPQAFDSTFSSQRVQKGPFSAFLLNGQYIQKVHDLDYQPQRADRFVVKDGLTWLNTYRPSDVVATPGDWAPFAEFMDYLVPEEDERAHLLKMLAWTVLNPGMKLRHALLLRSEHQGIGKTMLAEIWSELLGPHNVRKTTTEEVSGNFQGFIKENLLVLLEELNWGVGPMGYNRLKDLITSDTAVVNEKYMPVRNWPNFATFVILTNLETPILIEDKDRRIFFVNTPAIPREKSYYAEFITWWRAKLGVIRAFLETIDLSDFNPYAPPPMTRAKETLIAESRSELVKEIAFAVEERAGVFDRDIVTLDQIETQLGSSMRGKTKTQLVAALKAFGAVPFQQQRVPGMWNASVFAPMSGRASLWAIRNVDYWALAGAQERGEEFSRREGLLSVLHGVPVGICHVSEYPGDRSELEFQRIGRRITILETLEIIASHQSGRLPV
jgi:Bifunctional DNA primase/polymerase, N-terminal/Family of unknown function (DUF5906)